MYFLYSDKLFFTVAHHNLQQVNMNTVWRPLETGCSHNNISNVVSRSVCLLGALPIYHYEYVVNGSIAMLAC